jgi:hypothetical protein
MSEDTPVHLDRPLENRASQTMLRHYAHCPRSAFLYEKHRKDPHTTLEMQRGLAVHLIFERAVNLMLEQNEPKIPPDLVKVLVDEVLEEVPVPFPEHDFIRESAYRWAQEWEIYPPGVICNEQALSFEVEGWEVRCRIDYADVREQGKVLYIADYKSGRGALKYDSVARVRPDGSMMAKNFQLVLYALALTHSDFWKPYTQPERYELEFIYPGIESEGLMLRRTMTLTRPELDAYYESLKTMLRRLRYSETNGYWPAVESEEACGKCPAPRECPILWSRRIVTGQMESEHDVREFAHNKYLWGREMRRQQANARKWIKENGPVRYGNRVLEIGSEEKRTVDREGLAAALERGERVSMQDFVKVTHSSPTVDRDLTVDELEENSHE